MIAALDARAIVEARKLWLSAFAPRATKALANRRLESLRRVTVAVLSDTGDGIDRACCAALDAGVEAAKLVALVACSLDRDMRPALNEHRWLCANR